MQLVKLLTVGQTVWKFLTEVFPFVATFFIITSLSQLNQVLWFIALMLYILPKIGLDVNIVKRFKRFKKTRKLLSRWLKATSIVGRLEDDYIEETGDAIINTIKEVKNMKKLIVAFKLWLISNKAQILGVVAILLFILDYFIGFTKKTGLDPNFIYIIAAFLVAILFWVLGIQDGWTGNLKNQIKADALIAERAAKKEIKDFADELINIEARMSWIEKLGVPQEYQQEFNTLTVKRDKINSVIDQIKQNINQT